MCMKFDLSFFGDFGAWLWGMVKKLYQLLEFDFGEYSFNGWTLLIGVAVFSIIIILLGRLAE